MPRQDSLYSQLFEAVAIADSDRGRRVVQVPSGIAQAQFVSSDYSVDFEKLIYDTTRQPLKRDYDTEYVSFLSGVKEKMNLYNKFVCPPTGAIYSVRNRKLLEDTFNEICAMYSHLPDTGANSSEIRMFANTIISTIGDKIVGDQFVENAAKYGLERISSWGFRNPMLQSIGFWFDLIGSQGGRLSFDRTSSFWLYTKAEMYTDELVNFLYRNFVGVGDFFERMFDMGLGDIGLYIKLEERGKKLYLSEYSIAKMISTKEDLYLIRKRTGQDMTYFFMNTSLLSSLEEKGISLDIEDFDKLGFQKSELYFFMSSYIDNVGMGAALYNKVYNFDLKDLLEYQMGA